MLVFRSMLFLLLYAAAASTHASDLKEYLVKLAPEISIGQMRPLLSHVQTVRSDVFVAKLTSEVLAELEHDQRVLKVEPNHELFLLNTPNDLDSTLWGLKNPLGFDINALEAWSITTGSRDVVVAVTDTGIDPLHHELIRNLWVNEVEKNGQPGIDDDGNGVIDDMHGYDFAGDSSVLEDFRGHGTHVSGTIGALGDNGKDIVGVNWQVSLMTLNIFPRSSSARTSDAIRAIDYAVQNGAHVINASWGAPGDETDGSWTILRESIARAHAANVTFVAAAGNSSSDNDRTSFLPASFSLDSVISVGSHDDRGNRSSFSNFGRKSVHVFAPGSYIRSTVPGGGLGSKSGTSMAAPHVTGIVALMLSVNPALKPAEIRQILISTCTSNRALARDNVCRGHVNAGAALRSL